MFCNQGLRVTETSHLLIMETNKLYYDYINSTVLCILILTKTCIIDITTNVCSL